MCLSVERTRTVAAGLLLGRADSRHAQLQPPNIINDGVPSQAERGGQATCGGCICTGASSRFMITDGEQIPSKSS